MKNLFLTLSFLVVVTAQAQVRNYTKKTPSSSSTQTTVKRNKSSSSDEKPVQLLVLGAFQYSSIAGDDVLDNIGRAGFSAGLGLQRNLGNLLEFEMDALYGTMGTEFDDAMMLELSYVQVPLIFNFKLGQSGFKLGAGPQVGFLLDAKLDGEDFSDVMNSIDAGAVINGSMSFSSKLGMNVRYYYGLTNIFSDSPDFKVTNNAIFAGLYYKI